MKYFVVIGGSKGIGRELIKKLIKDQKNMVLLVSSQNIDIDSSNIIHFKTNLLNEEDIQNTLVSIKKISPKIDSLFFSQKYRLIDKSAYKLTEDLMVNVATTKIFIEYFKDKFYKNGLKSIVIIGSIASKFVATEQPVDYHISKSALVGLVNYYAVALGENKIRVNMISPSTVIKDENKLFYKTNKELYNLYRSISPSKSVLKSSNVVDLAKYLLFKKSKFITGQNIIIDGGISLQWQESIGRKLVNLDNLKLIQ